MAFKELTTEQIEAELQRCDDNYLEHHPCDCREGTRLECIIAGRCMPRKPTESAKDPA